MTIARVEIKDYKKFGEMLVHWTLHPDAKPKDLAEFKHETHGIVIVPDRIKTLEFYASGDLSELVVKLPNQQLVEESLERFKDPHSKYIIPPFYHEKVCEDDMSNLDFLYSRIADYTIAQCM